MYLLRKKKKYLWIIHNTLSCQEYTCKIHFMTSGLFCPYNLDESISSFLGCRLNVFIFILFCKEIP